MATLTIPGLRKTLTGAAEIRSFLEARGIRLEQWQTPHTLAPDASQEEVLVAYAHALEPYMARHGYATADVVSLHAGMPSLEALHERFFPEHTHTEDEVRFFVEGRGDFWFQMEGPESGSGASADPEEAVFRVRCEAGDLLSVPAGIRHWFDMGPDPRVKTIRLFTDTSGWTPHYTGSGVEKRYGRLEESASQAAEEVPTGETSTGEVQR